MQRQLNLNEKNQKAIEAQLVAGRRISVISVLQSVGTLELRTYLSKIRRKLSIADEWVTLPNGKRHKEYYLSKAE